MGSWHNALRAVPISDRDMETKRHRCICPENPDVNEFGDNSWLPCMSMEPDTDLKCKECIYCEIISESENKESKMANNINFGIIDLMIGTGFCSEEQTKQVLDILDNEPAVINYEKTENEDGSIMINIDTYDNKTIGDVLNKIANL